VQAVEKGGSGGRYGTGPTVSAIRAKQRRHACGGGRFWYGVGGSGPIPWAGLMNSAISNLNRFSNYLKFAIVEKMLSQT
jgi:hypothetical protein